MNGLRLLLALALIAALAGRAVHAQGDQSDIISAHGDALARATSAQALVQPMPTLPPNSAPPVIPSQSVVSIPAVASQPPTQPRDAGSPRMPIASAPQAPPKIAVRMNPAAPAPPPQTPEHERRYVLIAVGALLALAMFLWERRRPD